MVSIDWICDNLPVGWSHDRNVFDTRIIHYKIGTEELERLIPKPGDDESYTWDEVSNELIIEKMIKRPDSLFGIEIWSDYYNSIPHVNFWYRYKRSEFRMMQLLAEPPVPKDILRHIYKCIRK